MTAEIITIGDEILIGQVIDTNSAFIAEKLNDIGIDVRQITTVGDSKQQIFAALDNALKYSELVIFTGGLGPTDDDITKETLAEYFNTELEINKDVLSDIKKFISARMSKLNERNIKQAEVPKNCKIIRNQNGTAAGMWFEKNDSVIVSMPAVPFEMKEMTNVGLIPLLKKHFKTPSVIHKTVQTFGIPEAMLAEKLSSWEKQLPQRLKLAYLPSPERIRLRFSCISDDKKKSEDFINTEIEKLKSIIGDSVFGYGDVFLQEVIGEILKNKTKTIATAESCTGGNISRLITSVSGSSEYFKGSVVAYSNEIKERVLTVKHETLIKHGAVSKQTVEEMAKGVRELYKTDYAVSVSGIAGPEGGTKDKPVGTTWIAVADKNKVISKKYTFGTRRDINIRRASSTALFLLFKILQA